jgi:hypothetical protein
MRIPLSVGAFLHLHEYPVALITFACYNPASVELSSH